jgi:chromosome segregation ATPase
MRSCVALPLVAVLLAGHASSQGYMGLRGILLAQFGPGDLVLNKPLLDAIASEPAYVAELRQTLGETCSVDSIATDLPAPHLAGTFQIHLLIELSVRGALSDELQGKAVDAVVSHMKSRLEQLLYVQPLEQLTKRREELSRHHAELQAQRARLVARAAAATSNVAALQQHKRELEQQLLAARLDVATEKRGRDHLEKMLNTSTARRDETHEQIARRNAELTIQMGRLNDLTTRVETTSKEENERRRADIANLQAGVQAIRSAIDQLEEQAKDQQRMLAVVLEQMPTSALAIQRTDARLQGLEEEQKALAEKLDAAEALSAEAGQCEAEAERLQIDISVSMGLLTEIQGKLARLQPVHYELVRQPAIR